MADTFTSLLRLVLQETGGNENVWGSINNESLIRLVETAIAGRITVDVTLADVVLTTVNGATDQARNAMLAVIGNPGVARDVTVPSTSKIYMVTNETSPAFDVTIKTVAGAGIVISSGQIVFIYVDPSADDTFVVGGTLPAMESQAGIAEIATQAEVDAGSDDQRIVTAFKLANATSLLQATPTQKGALAIATEVEVDAGTDAIRAITPATLAAKPIVQNIQNGNYELVLTDANKHIYKASGAGNTLTIPANASVAFKLGDAVTFVNQSGNTVSIAITTDTMTLEGSGATGTRTLADDGLATALKVTATGWIISGGNSLT